MKTKTIELYEFEELPADVQEKVLGNERYINVDGDFWYDYDGKTGFNSKELKRMRLEPYTPDADKLITWKNMYFDIDRAWYIRFTDAEFNNDEIARRFLGVPKTLWSQVYWKFINRDYSGKSHGTTRLEYEHQDGYKEFTAKQAWILDRAVERFSDKMEEALRGLQNSYDYDISDEAVKDTILANEYTFTITGKMENV